LALLREHSLAALRIASAPAGLYRR
jgi:hypothetical protein